jgi:hypothetical protein
MKMTGMTPGWSSAGGQTLSPYVGPIAEDETVLGHTVSEAPRNGCYHPVRESKVLVVNQRMVYLL